MQVNPKDIAAGGIFIAIGLFFGLNAWMSLRIGKAFSMGPGFFPVVLGIILVALGLAIVLTAVGRRPEAFGTVPWRGIGMVMFAVIFFAVTVRGLGMAPSLGIATVVAAMSSGRISLLAAILVSIALTAFCVLVFIYALSLPYPVIGPWLFR
jgi:hypothetical protein